MTVHDVYTSGDVSVIVYELVEGGDLREFLASHPRPSWQWVARLVAAVADALHYAHECGFAHLDIKPANILLDHDKRPSIADFGLATKLELLARGTRLSGSTPEYASPEQLMWKAQECGSWSDIYSLGVVLYEMLTGALPPSAEARQEAARNGRDPGVSFPSGIRASTPESVLSVCMRALALDAGQRIPSARDMCDDLLRATDTNDTVTREHAAARLDECIREHERKQCSELLLLGGSAPLEAVYQQPIGLRRVNARRNSARLVRLSPPELLSEHDNPLGPGGRSTGQPFREHSWATSKPIKLTEIFGAWHSAAPESRSGIPRFAVLGPPGSGKSALLRHLAARAAGGDLNSPPQKSA